jgi:hypothetical protein
MFYSIDTAYQLVKSIIGDCYKTDLDTLIYEILEQSKGCKVGESIETSPAYRPYFVAAYYLTAIRPRGGIVGAFGSDGVKWEDIDLQIKRLLELQKLADKSLGCLDPNYHPDLLLHPDQHLFSAFVV